MEKMVLLRLEDLLPMLFSAEHVETLLSAAEADM